jgi:hypothetical protein
LQHYRYFDALVHMFEQALATANTLPADTRVLRTLRELGDEQWYAYVPFDEGAAVWESNIDGLVENLADRHGRARILRSRETS